MATVNYANPQTDRTIKIFDQFYAYETTVATDEYDAVNSYFQSVFGSKEAAGNFTVTVFRISHQTNVPVMNILQQFQGKSAPEITATLAYYLNGMRSSSTLLGINVATQPNYYVARNIRI